MVVSKLKIKWEANQSGGLDQVEQAAGWEALA
jgi:hypothetical protein